METVRVGIIGSGNISNAHVTAFRAVPGVEVVAQHSRNPERGRAFCENNRIPDRHDKLEDLLARDDVHAVTVALANHVHAEYTLAAIEAGKHVIVEKPLCLAMDDGRRMVDAARERGVVLGYAEELCYLPKFVRARELADAGAVGDPFFVKCTMKHGGAYSPWFFTVEEAGGGILMDMGCHAIELCRWMLGKPQVVSVYADVDRFVHNAQPLDDHVMMIVEFEGRKKALVESSWTRVAGMELSCEVHGPKGVVHAEVHQKGMGLSAYSADGGPVVAKGWSAPSWESVFINGYPAEMADFVRAVRTGEPPLETGEDGLAVLEIMIAGYQSAATGRRIDFPFDDPGGYRSPVELWLRAEAAR